MVEMHFGRDVAPGGFAWTVPITRAGAPRLKVGTMASGNAGAYLNRFLEREDLRDRLRAEPPAPIRRLLPLRPIPKTFADRVLVVGDAGGFTKPTTGGGVFYSLLTATLAAETLIDSLKAGRLDDAFLSRYERRWQERLGQELRVADWLRTLSAKCTDREIDALVDAMASDDVQGSSGARRSSIGTATRSWPSCAIQGSRRCWPEASSARASRR
jgi:flavin-dependent dehydrogenase